MSDFVIGEPVKIQDENRVFILKGFTSGLKHIPDGWLIEDDGFYVNPRYCEKYKGATSVLGDRHD